LLFSKLPYSDYMRVLSRMAPPSPWKRVDLNHRSAALSRTVVDILEAEARLLQRNWKTYLAQQAVFRATMAKLEVKR
jgi:hypothetical protein